MSLKATFTLFKHEKCKNLFRVCLKRWANNIPIFLPQQLKKNFATEVGSSIKLGLKMRKLLSTVLYEAKTN